MEIKTKFEEGQKVSFFFLEEKHEAVIKSIEIRTMNTKVYIKYRLMDGSWKNEEELICIK